MSSTAQNTGFSSGTSQSTSTSKTRIVPGMLKIYNQLLAKNEQNYQNILSGYTQAQTNLQSAQSAAYGGYDTLQQNVMNTLGVGGGGWGVAAPAAAEIARGFTKAQGTTQQQMINAGLGNSTLLGNLTNQNQLQAGQAYGNLGAQLADKAAGYISSIGQARQAAMLQGAGQLGSLASSYLGNLAGFKFANTAGDLTGTFSRSSSTSQQEAQNQGSSSSFADAGGGGGSSGQSAQRGGPRATANFGAGVNPGGYGYVGGTDMQLFPSGGGQQYAQVFPSDSFGNANASPTPESGQSIPAYTYPDQLPNDYGDFGSLYA